MPQERRKVDMFPISCDVVTSAKQYSAFLQRYRHLQPPITDRKLLRAAALRYEYCWLPLVAERRSNDCFPPWDVYYVWHLHMLLPQSYKKYCERMYNRVIGHSFVGSGEQERLKRIATKAMWKQKYPHEPYDLTEVRESEFKDTRLAQTLVDTDPKIADFHHQLSACHYNDDEFLRRASYRYGQFMHMVKMRAGGYLPATDIELLWKAHMLCPVAYGKDTQTYFRRVIDLDSESYARDSIDGPRFIAGIQGTSSRWREVYHSKYLLPGCAVKNIQNYALMTPLDPVLTSQRYSESCELILNNFRVVLPSSKRHHVNIQLKRVNKSNNHQEFFKGTVEVGVQNSASGVDGLGKVLFDTQYHSYIEVVVTAGGKAGCVAKNMEFNTKFFPQDLFQDDLFHNKSFEIDLDVYSGSDPKVHLSCSVRIPADAPSHFQVSAGTFEHNYIARELEPFVNIHSWANIDYNDPKACHEARHEIRRKPGYLHLYCRIIATSNMKLAAVMVFAGHNDKQATIALSITNDVLPIQKQVSESCEMTFQADDGDRAMVIQNSDGDWGYCLAKLIPGKYDDTIKILFYLVSKNSTQEFLVNTSNYRHVRIDWLNFDVVTANINIGAGCDQLAEYATLAFVIGTLHMITINQPHPNSTQLRDTDDFRIDPNATRMKGRQEKATPMSDSQTKKRRNSVFSVKKIEDTEVVTSPVIHQSGNYSSDDPSYDTLSRPTELSTGQLAKPMVQTRKDRVHQAQNSKRYEPASHPYTGNGVHGHIDQDRNPRRFEVMESGDIYTMSDNQQICAPGQVDITHNVPASRPTAQRPQQKRTPKTPAGIITTSKGPLRNSFEPSRSRHHHYSTSHAREEYPEYDKPSPIRRKTTPVNNKPIPARRNYQPPVNDPFTPPVVTHHSSPHQSNRHATLPAHYTSAIQRAEDEQDTGLQRSKSTDQLNYPTRRGKQTDRYMDQRTIQAQYSPEQQVPFTNHTHQRRRGKGLQQNNMFSKSTPRLESCV